MNRISIVLNRLLVRLCRLPRRYGHGVHSPFAFNLITQVVNQRTPYYKYDELAALEKRLKKEKDRAWLYEPRSRKRLLFRLVNFVQPDTLLDVGTLAASSLYLKAAREAVDYTAATGLSELFLEADTPVDFLYLHDYRRPDLVEEVFRLCATRSRGKSLFVIEGIGYTPSMRSLWQRIREDERTGITFDLYDLGLIFFDKTKLKQHYQI